MERPPTISTAPLEHPALDFARLREEGLALLQRLAGHRWTDHNVHDPGVTILEQVCYALTDLAYRIGYDLEDLLAEGAEADPYASLYSPAEVLTTHPVTLTDLRKVIIDVAGVKNAWVEPVAQPEPPLFYDPGDQTLYLAEAPHRQAVALQGIFRVLIEADGTRLDTALTRAVSRRPQACRSLCQDFEPPHILPQQKIAIDADVEIGETADPVALSAHIFDAVARAISPAIRFYTLPALLARGKRIDEIFDGPLLDHGFIDTDELERFGRRDALRTSDLIQTIMDVDGVRAVRSIELASAGQTQAWYLQLDPDSTPVLDLGGSRVRLVRGHVSVEPAPSQVRKRFDDLQRTARAEPLPRALRDVRLPPGRARHVAHYTSIQHHFPEVYGIGERGLPAAPSPQRTAHARQLKAYLLFFDQLLAMYFSQTAHARDLFAFEPQALRTYFAQPVSTAPDAHVILRHPPEEHAARVQDAAEEEATALDRRDRFLNHLLARFSEQFTDYALLTHEHVSKDRLIDVKRAFLQDYGSIGSARGRAFDYTRPTWGTDNVSGLEKRLSRKLGFGGYTRRALADLEAADDGGFHLVEHLLLRPQPPDREQWDQAERILGPAHALLALPVRTDPYSAQLSFVLPDWISRMKSAGFRAFIHRTIREETPAHLSIYLHWLGRDRMRDFEDAFRAWLASLRS